MKAPQKRAGQTGSLPGFLKDRIEGVKANRRIALPSRRDFHLNRVGRRRTQGFAKLQCIPAKRLILLRGDLAKPWNTIPSCQSGLADLLSARDYEVVEKSRRPRSDAKEQV
jgi:hypothetical protein